MGLRITYDPTRRTLLVTGLSHHAWMLFSVVDSNVMVEAMSANVWYDQIITGAPSPSDDEKIEAWKLVRFSVLDLVAVSKGEHCRGEDNGSGSYRQGPHSKITYDVAHLLAARDRWRRFGTLSHDSEIIPTLERRMSPAELHTIFRRERGIVVL